jgi:hypothetical protein
VVNRRMLGSCPERHGATGGPVHRRLLLESSFGGSERKQGIPKIPLRMSPGTTATMLVNWKGAKRVLRSALYSIFRKLCTVVPRSCFPS